MWMGASAFAFDSGAFLALLGDTFSLGGVVFVFVVVIVLFVPLVSLPTLPSTLLLLVLVTDATVLPLLVALPVFGVLPALGGDKGGLSEDDDSVEDVEPVLAGVVNGAGDEER